MGCGKCILDICGYISTVVSWIGMCYELSEHIMIGIVSDILY